MEINAANSKLLEVPIDAIERNKENPRIVFRPGELEKLLESIRRFGIQVPISVYRKGKKYILIDGERRWRCSIKLNRKTIPALVQDEPSPLLNLLLMFNIHGLREQWDLLTIALKLPRVIQLTRPSQFEGLTGAKPFRISEGYPRVFTTEKGGATYFGGIWEALIRGGG